MNSLQDLNDYSATSVDFTDLRPANLVYVEDSTVDTDISIDEGDTHVLPLQYRITDIIQPATLNVEMVINFTQIPGAQLYFDSNLLGSIVVTDVDDVWTITGIDTVEIYELLANTEVVLPRDFTDASTYLVTVNTDLAFGFNYSVNVTIADLSEMTAVSQFNYTVSAANAITGYPQITDAENPATDLYTVVISQYPLATFPGSLASAGSGGTSTWNSGAGTLTIAGTKTQVNSHLAAITFTADSTSAEFYFRYTLTNDESGFVTVRDQRIIDNNTLIFGVTTADYYDEDTIVSPLEGTPVVIDDGQDGSGTYTVLVSEVDADTISLLSSAGTLGGTSTWNGTSKTLTITGTRAEVNDHLATITLTPYPDQAADFPLAYQVTTPLSAVATRVQFLLIGDTHDEITNNINLFRPYVQNTENILFATDIPQITDENPTATYTVRFTSDAGGFGLQGSYPSLDRSISGTKSYINETVFPTLRFWPSRDVTGTQSFRYRQYADGRLQIDTTVLLLGTDRTTPLDQQNTYSYTSSGSHTASIYQRWYLKCDILVVGGGAGGINWTGDPTLSGSMGGPSGGFIYITDHPVMAGLTVTVGAGGLGYTGSGAPFPVSSTFGELSAVSRSIQMIPISVYAEQLNLPDPWPGACTIPGNLSGDSEVRMRIAALGGSLLTDFTNDWFSWVGRWQVGQYLRDFPDPQPDQWLPYLTATTFRLQEPCRNFLPNPTYEFWESSNAAPHNSSDEISIIFSDPNRQRYLGSVATVEDLPESPSLYDIWWVIDEKTFYAYTPLGSPAVNQWAGHRPMQLPFSGGGAGGGPTRSASGGVPPQVEYIFGSPEEGYHTPPGAYDTGGAGISNSITGSAVTYAAGGSLLTGDLPTGYNNPGSGGRPGENGQPGIVIIKYHS